MENRDPLKDDSISAAIETLYADILEKSNRTATLVKSMMSTDVSYRNSILGEIEMTTEIMKGELERLHDTLYQVDLLKKFIEDYNV